MSESQSSVIMKGRPSDKEINDFTISLKSQLEIFVNRMKSNSSRGRPIAHDSSVQTLFMNTMTMHSKLLRYIQDQEDRRIFYEGLQDKISQVKDARAALEALREEEAERIRREAEEAERIRQIQMKEKLELMRHKKQEYLQYQRQMALQRMQEQEREMHLRQEQAKQFYQQQRQQGTGSPAPPVFQQTPYYGVVPGQPQMMPPMQYRPYMPNVQYHPMFMGQQNQSLPPNGVNQMPQGLPAVSNAEIFQAHQVAQGSPVVFNMQSLSSSLPQYQGMQYHQQGMPGSPQFANNTQQFNSANQVPAPNQANQQQAIQQQELIVFD